MVDKVFGADFTDETAPVGTATVSVNTGAALVDVELQNLHKALTQATETQAGTVELATNGEGLLGSDTARAITAAVLAYMGIKTGWIPDTNTWTYSSADSPTFVISINADMTGLIGVGDKIKLTQTTAKYFIVTAVGSFSGSATLITVYGGTDYTLANAAITSPYYSHHRSPFGFPMSRNKWRVTYSNTADATQASPASGTWYNAGSQSVSLPIGQWRIYWEGVVGMSVTTTGTAQNMGVRATLSTANNSESDADFTASFTITAPNTLSNSAGRQTVHREKILDLASKTTYYLNVQTVQSLSSIGFFGSVITTVVIAECAYL